LREVFASHELFISDQVLIELRRVLQSKFGVSQELIDDFIELLERDSIPAQPGQLPRVELKDSDDLTILGAAISAGAEVLVTGDRELLNLNRISDLEVLSPRQFWEKLKAQQRGGGRKEPRRSR
jgi:predicted nucleic acid-binding protein